MNIDILKELLFSSDWQDIQDMLNETMRTKILWVVTSSGASILKSEENYHQLCQLIRDSREGLRHCQNSHHGRFQEAKRTGRPVLSVCYCGLMCFAVPIKLDGKLIGLAGGNIPQSEFPMTVEKCAEISVACGLDVKEIMEYAKGIKHISKAEQKQALNQLSILAGMLPPLLKWMYKALTPNVTL
jgi:ligand-binding sensor protein